MGIIIRSSKTFEMINRLAILRSVSAEESALDTFRVADSKLDADDLSGKFESQA